MRSYLEISLRRYDNSFRAHCGGWLAERCRVDDSADWPTLRRRRLWFDGDDVWTQMTGSAGQRVDGSHRHTVENNDKVSFKMQLVI